MPFRLNMLEEISAGNYINVIRDPHTQISFSQFGEDTIILDILVHDIKKPFGGFYVDVGAFHPRFLSTTRLLKFLNWKGINIDANDDVISLFKLERPEDINICCGVAPSEGEMNYHKFEGGATNTLSNDMASHQTRNGAKVIGSDLIKVRTINQILKENLPIDQQIDYMNIDLEGLDRAVLKSLDLDLFRPTVISIELFGINILNLRDDPTISYLINKNYYLAAAARDTYIFYDLNQSTSTRL